MNKRVETLKKVRGGLLNEISKTKLDGRARNAFKVAIMLHIGLGIYIFSQPKQYINKIVQTPTPIELVELDRGDVEWPVKKKWMSATR